MHHFHIYQPIEAFRPVLEISSQLNSNHETLYFETMRRKTFNTDIWHWKYFFKCVNSMSTGFILHCLVVLKNQIVVFGAQKIHLRFTKRHRIITSVRNCFKNVLTFIGFGKTRQLTTQISRFDYIQAYFYENPSIRRTIEELKAEDC